MNPSSEVKDKPRQQFIQDLKKMPRWKLLPHLFQIKGQPYSLDDYPQFEVMYGDTYTPEMLFMCGRQVAKSTNLSRSEVLDCIQIPRFQVLFVAPLQSQSQRYSTLYLKEAINTCKPAKQLQEPQRLKQYRESDIGLTKAVMHQTFMNGAGIQLTYAKSDADRARGITSDRIDFDEIQDQLTDHIPIISEALANSSWGIRRYTGTAKTTDNTIEHLWKRSSRGEWCVKCGCGHWNIPDKDHNVLDMIQAAGPVCVKCGSILNVREGQWVHGSPDLIEEFPGYHIPQIMLPAMVYDKRKWAGIIDKVTKLPPGIIYTEILGISSDTGVRLITQKDIDDCSILGTHKEMFEKCNHYAFRVLGIDWGIAEISSFTVATVVGINHRGEVHVLYAKRYVGQDIEEVLHDIVRMARTYRVDMVAPDFGVGFTNNALLKNRDLRVVQLMYCTQNKFLSYNELHGQARWTVDRNTALTVMYWNIRNRKILFVNKGESETYTQDLLSPYEEVVEKSSGIVTKKFMRDPSKPDDFCHALTFACLVLYHLTQSPLLTMTPEHAGDYTGAEFYDQDGVDSGMVMDAMRNI